MKIINYIIAGIAALFAVTGLFTAENALHEIITALSAITFLLAQVANNTMPKKVTK